MVLSGVRFSYVDMMKAGAALEGKIRELGVAEIELHDEVSSYQARVGTSNKGYVGEYFHRNINTLPPSMFQGFTCSNSEGDIIATTALRKAILSLQPPCVMTTSPVGTLQLISASFGLVHIAQKRVNR